MNKNIHHKNQAEQARIALTRKGRIVGRSGGIVQLGTLARSILDEKRDSPAGA